MDLLKFNKLERERRKKQTEIDLRVQKEQAVQFVVQGPYRLD